MNKRDLFEWHIDKALREDSHHFRKKIVMEAFDKVINKEQILPIDCVSISASDVKYFTKFISDSSKIITSGNYMHKIQGIEHAAKQIDKLIDK